MSRPPNAKLLRVAAVWGTQVLVVRHLRAGEPLVLGDTPTALIAKPEGCAAPDEPLRAAGTSWELDPRGASGGTIRLRGRDEDPVALAQGGGVVPLLPGDYGLLQYGQFALFFQFTDPIRLAAKRPRLDLGLLAGFLVSAFSIGGALFALKQVTPEDALPKPLELTSAAELSRQLRLPPIPPPVEVDSGGEKSAKPDEPSGGGKAIAGAEGKLGKRGPAPNTKIPGARPGLGGMSEVLGGSVGQEVAATLGSISSVAAALGGLRSDQLVLGQGSGTGLRGSGPGGGGDGPGGVPYGSGNLDTGFGSGSGPGGPGGGGRGLGNGSGSGSGSGTGERTVGAAKAAAPGQGLSPDAIQRVVMSRYGAFRACYDSAAAQDPTLSGTVSISFRIAPGGSVQSANVAGSSLNNPRVEGCVLRQIKRLQFPAADKGTSASFPFAFKPSKR